jgi:hypothetical protein
MLSVSCLFYIIGVAVEDYMKDKVFGIAKVGIFAGTPKALADLPGDCSGMGKAMQAFGIISVLVAAAGAALVLARKFANMEQIPDKIGHMGIGSAITGGITIVVGLSARENSKCLNGGYEDSTGAGVFWVGMICSIIATSMLCCCMKEPGAGTV